MGNDNARVTIVVIPRERFSRTEVSLECLYQNTPAPFNLIYVDGHSPSRVRRYLEQQARERMFQLIRVPEFMPCARLRNIALREVTTPFVVFMENDVLVRPGWLPPLVQCAEETGAAGVAPLYLEQQDDREFVHMAGGLARVDDVDGSRRIVETIFLQGAEVADVRPTLQRCRTELIELHCVLLRADSIREVGGFDEGIQSTADHVDLSLVMMQAGHTLYMEPASTVVFVQPPPFAWYDLPFYFTRWSDPWARQTISHFRRKWRLAADDPFLAYKYQWTRVRRRFPLTRLVAKACPVHPGQRLVDRCLTPLFDAVISPMIARSGRAIAHRTNTPE